MTQTTQHASRPARRLRNRAGFTLVEVIVASVILTAALLAMAGFSIRYQQVDSSARIVNRAQQAANSRLELVRTAQPYSAIDTMATTESSIPTLPGYTRTTAVTRMGGSPTDTVDYKIITVTVTTPGVARTVKKTSFVGAF
jgi:prepilin-type N-terminal cleavage/methylation domain-containing protein